MKIDVIYNDDCLEGLKLLPDNSVDCCVTSPPYYGLRDYGSMNQIGQEETVKEFIIKLKAVFEEVRRVLKSEGTLWLNIGDSYASSGKNRTEDQAISKSTLGGGKKTQVQVLKQKSKIVGDLKEKDLIGIPWTLAFELRSAGWYLRQDIIWHKPNPMPESVTDRCTKSHEYIFLLSKSKKYYYDAESIATEYALKTFTTFGSDIKGYGDGSGLCMAENRANSMNIRKPKEWRKPRPDDNRGGNQGIGDIPPVSSVGKANKRSVWTVGSKPLKEAHFATFPETLIVDCIKAGCPEGGIVLDPFMDQEQQLLLQKN